MDDLVVWLRVQLDEDERVAPGVHSEDCALHAWLRSDVPSACDCGWPDRIRREVEAKRRILGRHQPIEIFGAMLCTHCGVAGGQRAQAVAAWPCPELRDLAAPYSDRPGYNQEWAA